jgi:LacI family transcriptional regulator
MRPKRSATTIHDVARAAGVSVTTASRVLNNKGDVAPETFAKVQRVIAELNYTASLAARSMRSRTTGVIGLIVPDLVGSYILEIVKGVGAAITEFAYDLLVFTHGSRTPGYASWEREHVSLLSGGLTDGCVVVTPSAPSFPETARVVVIDPHGDGAGVPSVIATNHAGAMAAMAHLVALGHRRIGFIGGLPELQSAARRLQGYKDSLSAAGIAYDPLLAIEGDYTHASGQAGARRLLGLPQPPTAIFAGCDLAALGVMDVAREMGVCIPNDLSLIGFDNIPEAAQVTPQLTTVDQSIQQMGYLATKMLVRMLAGEALESTLCKVPTHLVIRESCLAIETLQPTVAASP